jgi:hypothetical protein
VPFLPLDPGYRMGKKSGSGSTIWDEQPRSYFQELRNNFFFGSKYLNYFMQIQDPEWKKFGSGMEKFWIQDKHLGSATLFYIFMPL